MTTFEGNLTTICVCCMLERSDGTGFAITSHNQDVTMGLETFRPAAGFLPNALQQGDSNHPTTEFSSALNTGFLRDEDLKLGRWDHARVTLRAADWESPEQNAELSVGQFDEVELHDGNFTVEVAGAAPLLQRAVCPATSPECRASLGDKQCRVDLAPLRLRASITGTRGSWLDLDSATGSDFQFGSLRFLGGSLSGLTQTIVDTADRSVRVRDDLSSKLSVGTGVQLLQGCDKRPDTCRTRFRNMMNFRGEPHVPGTDFLMRYPGA